MPKRISKAAYFLIDIHRLPPEARREVIEDAAAGGGTYGVQVVEIAHNGPATQAIYGVYYDTAGTNRWRAGKTEDVGKPIQHESLWLEACQEWNIDPLTLETDEEAAATKAQLAADADAAAARQREDADLALAGVKTDDDPTKANLGASGSTGGDGGGAGFASAGTTNKANR